MCSPPAPHIQWFLPLQVLLISTAALWWCSRWTARPGCCQKSAALKWWTLSITSCTCTSMWTLVTSLHVCVLRCVVCPLVCLVTWCWHRCAAAGRSRRRRGRCRWWLTWGKPRWLPPGSSLRLCFSWRYVVPLPLPLPPTLSCLVIMITRNASECLCEGWQIYSQSYVSFQWGSQELGFYVNFLHHGEPSQKWFFSLFFVKDYATMQSHEP